MTEQRQGFILGVYFKEATVTLNQISPSYLVGPDGGGTVMVSGIPSHRGVCKYT